MGFEVYMQDILRNISSALLVPVMVVLAAFCIYALYCVGSVITEAVMQRRHYKENIPQFIQQIEAADPQDIRNVILKSGMLDPHKKALLVVADNMGMTSTDLFALASREEELLEERYMTVTARTDQIAKLAPMFGLMGTLIPLGPGIVALGIGDTATLSSSLLVAFDTTVAGLASGAVCSVVGRVRKSWYKKYTDAVHASMVCILEKAENLRLAGNVCPISIAEEVAQETAAIESMTRDFQMSEPEREISAAPSLWASSENHLAEETQQPTEQLPVVTTVYPRHAAAEAARNAHMQREEEALQVAMSPIEDVPHVAASIEETAPEAAMPSEETLQEAAAVEFTEDLSQPSELETKTKVETKTPSVPSPWIPSEEPEAQTQEAPSLASSEISPEEDIVEQAEEIVEQAEELIEHAAEEAPYAQFSAQQMEEPEPELLQESHLSQETETQDKALEELIFSLDGGTIRTDGRL